MILDFFVILKVMDVVKRLIFLNNLLLKFILDVEVITKGLNTYEKNF